MSFTREQQIDQLFKKSEQFLLLVPESAGGDHIGSAWALASFLGSRGKSVTVAGQHLKTAHEQYSFLPAPETLLDSLVGLRDFVVSFATKYNKILGIRSEADASEYRIYVTPERGAIDPRDFSILPVKFRYDCLIVLGATDKESLGTLYAENPDIFYEVPIINIDCHSENENFGQVNMVEMTASSVSEILADFLETLSPGSIDTPIAECLLTGIMSATDSFQKKNTTPKTLQTAARLMDQGADQQKIVQHLFKTQPFHLLKLWGLVMARLSWDDSIYTLVGTITMEDLQETQASRDDIPTVLEKIKGHYLAGHYFLLIVHDDETGLTGFLKTRNRESLAGFLKHWPDASRNGETLEIRFSTTDPLEAEQLLRETIRATKPAR